VIFLWTINFERGREEREWKRGGGRHTIPSDQCAPKQLLKEDAFPI
jgi:hypothetical protein